MTEDEENFYYVVRSLPVGWKQLMTVYLIWASCARDRLAGPRIPSCQHDKVEQ